MFARHEIASVKQGKLDEALRLYQERILPEGKQHKGYRGVYLLTDRTKGKIITISLWDSQEDAAAIDGNGSLRTQSGLFQDVLDTPMTNEGYEVCLMLAKTK